MFVFATLIVAAVNTTHAVVVSVSLDGVVLHTFTAGIIQVIGSTAAGAVVFAVVVVILLLYHFFWFCYR